MNDPRFPPRRSSFGGFGGALSGPPPRDLVVLLGVVFFTFSLQFFSATATVPLLLRLSSAVWQLGWVWQLFTYPFSGTGAPGFFFLLELFILYTFGRTVLRQLGRRGFWRLLVGAAFVSALAAMVVQLLGRATGFLFASPFALMQGQHMLLVILVAAFATLNSQATILLFFVLPIQARLFLGLEILFAFMGFLATHDLPGFVGVCVAVGGTWLWLTPGRLRQVVLRFQERLLRRRMAWTRRRRGIRLVDDKDEKPDDPGPGPYIH